MNIRVFNFIFFYLIFLLKSNILCMYINPTSNKKPCLQEKSENIDGDLSISDRLLIRAYLSQYYVDICGENIFLKSSDHVETELDEVFSGECQCSDNDLSAIARESSEFAEKRISKEYYESAIALILSQKVCQFCAAARAVKLLLLGDYLFDRLEAEKEDNTVFCFQKKLVLKEAKRSKFEIINGLVCSHEIIDRFEGKDKDKIKKSAIYN